MLIRLIIEERLRDNVIPIHSIKAREQRVGVPARARTFESRPISLEAAFEFKRARARIGINETADYHRDDKGRRGEERLTEINSGRRR